MKVQLLSKKKFLTLPTKHSLEIFILKILVFQLIHDNTKFLLTFLYLILKIVEMIAFIKTFHNSIPLFMLSSLTLDHQITTKADSAFTSITPSDFSNCSSSVN